MHFTVLKQKYQLSPMFVIALFVGIAARGVYRRKPQNVGIVFTHARTHAHKQINKRKLLQNSKSIALTPAAVKQYEVNLSLYILQCLSRGRKTENSFRMSGLHLYVEKY